MTFFLSLGGDLTKEVRSFGPSYIFSWLHLAKGARPWLRFTWWMTLLQWSSPIQDLPGLRFTWWIIWQVSPWSRFTWWMTWPLGSSPGQAGSCNYWEKNIYMDKITEIIDKKMWINNVLKLPGTKPPCVFACWVSGKLCRLVWSSVRLKICKNICANVTFLHFFTLYWQDWILFSDPLAYSQL